jgi:lipoate-protein ligase A
MALDDALLEARARNEIGDCIRFFQFYPSTVTLGRFQSLKREVNIELCSKEGIGVVRRPTGGGTVFHDANGELTFSVVMGQTEGTRTIRDAFIRICGGVVEGLRILGADATFSPVNDITVSGKKLSGSAQARRKDALLVHGTVMYDTDIQLLSRLLVVSKRKLEAKGVPSVEKRVTTLRAEGLPYDLDTVSAALRRGFSSILGPLEPAILPAHVSAMALNLHDSLYSTAHHTSMLP